MSTPTAPVKDLGAGRSPQIIWSVLLRGFLASIHLVGRLGARRILKAGILTSDYLLLLGFVTAWIATGLAVWDAKLGLGKHIEVVEPSHIVTFLKTIYVEEICYSISLPSVKISILLLYRSIFTGTHFEIYTYITGAFVLAWGIAVLLVAIFSCRPVQGFWEITLTPKPECINTRAFVIGNSSFNILADVLILCLPQSKVWHLQMSKRSRLAVSGMFLLGGFVIVASCVRMKFLLTISEEDATWSYYGVVVWSAVELNVAVMSACLPTMKPLVRAVRSVSLFRKLLGSQKTGDLQGLKSSTYPRGRSPKSIPDEEFQRLPDCVGDRATPLGEKPRGSIVDTRTKRDEYEMPEYKRSKHVDLGMS